MKTLRYTTKADSNAEREQAFLALSGEERLVWFFSHSKQMAAFAKQDPTKDSSTFVLDHKAYGESLG